MCARLPRPVPEGGKCRWMAVSRHSGRAKAMNCLADERLMSVSVAPGATWSPGPAKVVLKDPYFWGTTAGAAAAAFDISPDGRRLLMIRPVKNADAPEPPSSIIVSESAQSAANSVSFVP